jgi:hypothetical protein
MDIAQLSTPQIETPNQVSRNNDSAKKSVPIRTIFSQPGKFDSSNNQLQFSRQIQTSHQQTFQQQTPPQQQILHQQPPSQQHYSAPNQQRFQTPQQRALTDSSNFSTETMEVGDSLDLRLNAPPEFRTNTHQLLQDNTTNMTKKVHAGGKGHSLETPAKRVDQQGSSEAKHNPMSTGDRVASSGGNFAPILLNSTPKFTRQQHVTSEKKNVHKKVMEIQETPPEQRRLFESEEFDGSLTLSSQSNQYMQSRDGQVLSPGAKMQGTIGEYYAKFSKPAFTKKQESTMFHELDTFYESAGHIKNELRIDKSAELSKVDSKAFQSISRDNFNKHNMNRYHSCDFSKMGYNFSLIQKEAEPGVPDAEKPFYHQRAEAIPSDEKDSMSTTFDSLGKSQAVFFLNQSMITSNNPAYLTGRSILGDLSSTNRSQLSSHFHREDLEYLKQKYLKAQAVKPIALEGINKLSVDRIISGQTDYLTSERVAMVFCRDCQEYVDLRQSITHGKICSERNKEALGLRNEGPETVEDVNERLKGLMNLMLERAKRFEGTEKVISFKICYQNKYNF